MCTIGSAKSIHYTEIEQRCQFFRVSYEVYGETVRTFRILWVSGVEDCLLSRALYFQNKT